MRARYRAVSTLVVLSTWSITSAAIINVPADQPTIQAAVTAATTGVDTIVVAAGTYVENVTLNKNLILQGAQAGVDARGRVAGAPNPLVESVISPASGVAITLVGGSAGSTIDGFAIQGGTRGIESTSGPINDLTIRNNHLEGMSSSAMFLNDSGIDITIHQNVLIGSSASGTVLHLDQDNFDGLHLTSNHIRRTGAPASTGWFVDGNHNVGASVNRSPVISQNEFSGHAVGANVGRFAVEFATISNNVFKDNSFDGMQGGAQNCTITLNTFSNNGRSGLSLTGFGGGGDSTRGAQNNAITCNLFLGNGLLNNGEAVFFSSSQFAGTISTNTLNNNNITSNNAGATYAGAETINAENNWWGTSDGPGGSGPGTGDTISSANIDADPFLVAQAPCAPAAPVTTVYDVGLGDLASGKPEFSQPHGTGTNPFAYDWDSAPPHVAAGAPSGFGSSSFYADVAETGATDADRYRTFRLGQRDLFPPGVNVGDVASITYQTKKPGPQTAIDWRISIYTTAQGNAGDSASWYRSRIQATPSNSGGLNAPANQWNQWATAAGTNQLMFYQSNRTGFSTPDIAWSELIAGTVTRGANNWDYSGEEIMMIDFTLGANSGGGTGESQIDAIEITLTNGDKAIINLGNPGPGTLELAFDDTCYKTGDTVTATLSMKDLGTEAAGFQAFLEYDDAALTFTGWSYTAAPFGLPVLNTPAVVNPSPGLLDLASGINQFGGQSASMADADLVTLTFTVAGGDDCEAEDLLVFRNHAPPTRITDIGGDELTPLTTIDAPTVNIDSTAPIVTAGTIDSCYPTVAAAEAAAIAATTVTDNCTPPNPAPAVAASTTGTCAAVITVTATDCAGNQASVQYNTRIDNTLPVLTIPANATVQCLADADPGLPYATVTGGIGIYYNDNGQGENPANQAYLKAQRTATSSAGAPLAFSTVQLTGVPGLTWAFLYGDQGQYGLDLVLEAPTSSPPPATPVLNAYNNGDNTLGGRILVGPVAWAIDDYKPHLPNLDAGAVLNSIVRGGSPGSPGDIVITRNDVSVSGTIYTAHIQGHLVSDGTHHWYNPATPDSPMSNFALNGTIYFDGVLTYDTSTDTDPLMDFYAGTITLTANFPSSATGFATATDNCTTLPVISYTDTDNGGTGCLGNPLIITRTWKAVDECGNESTGVQTITVEDNTAPVVTAPPNVVLECDESTAPANTGTATAVDNCDLSVSVTHSDSSLGTCPTIITRTWSSTDSCGNVGTAIQYITVQDTTAPVISCPADIVTNADAGVCTATLVPGGASFNETFDVNPDLGVWTVDRYAPQAFESAVFAGDNRLRIGIDVADSSANRPPSYASSFYNTQGRTRLLNGAGPGTTISADVYIPLSWATQVRRTDLWTRDTNLVEGNAIYPIIGFTSKDPVAANQTDTSGTPTPRYRWWDSSTGWVDLLTPVVYDTWHTLSITLNNSAQYEYRIDGVLVATDPNVSEIGAQAFKQVFLQAYNFGETYDAYWDNVKTNNVGTATATDNCDPSVTITGVRSDAQALSAPYPAGVTTITWTATDACGNSSQCPQTVTVNAVNEVAVDVELENVSAGPFTRCITFEVWDCSSSPVIVNQEVSFTSGLGTALLEVPCNAAYTCITARDKRHTLRSTAALSISGTQYVANFTGVKELRGGNLNDDFYIDILDFGVFAGQYNMNYGTPNTTCATPHPHADISGDQIVGTADFSFIQNNFLKTHEANCCSAPLGPEPLLAIPTDPADVNGDGVVNIEDMNLVKAQMFKPLTPANAVADVNGDGVINIVDLNVVKKSLFQPVAAQDGPVTRISVDELNRRNLADLTAGDINGDGWLDQQDIAAWLSGQR